MKKKINCPTCGGSGFVAKFSSYSVWSERCEQCNGTGEIEVPFTIGDKIRSMSEWKTVERKQFNILCGNAQLLECPQCGTLSVVDFAYCPGCGKDMHIPEDRRFKMRIDSNKCQYACVMQSYVPLTESVYLKPEDMPSLHDLIKEMYKYKEMYGM